MTRHATELAASWAPRILADLGEGAQMRVPLAVFYAVAVRRDVESALAASGRVAHWNDARQSLDDAGRVMRIVPVVRLAVVPASSSPAIAVVAERHDTIDESWDDA